MSYPYPPSTSPTPLDDWRNTNSHSPAGAGSNTPRLSGYGLSQQQPAAGLPTAAHFNTNRLSPFFNNNNQRTLPMYKDKPYFAPRRTGPRSRRRKTVYTGLCVFVVALVWLYMYGGPVSWGGFGVRSTPDWAKGAELYEWVQGLDEKAGGENGKHVDWEARRERVRDAMIVSWDGYEQYGWGELCLLWWALDWKLMYYDRVR